MTQGRFPLTLTQRDIYLDQLRHEGSPLYNIGGYIQLRDIDVARLTDAHRRLVNECEIFGLRISSTKDGVYQEISPARNDSLPVYDFSANSDSAEAVGNWLTALFENPVEVHDTELFRASLLKIADGQYRYVGLAHHLMMDGWGFANWARSLCQLYHGLSIADASGLAWRDVALDDEKYLASERYGKDKEYWAEHIGEVPTSLFPPRRHREFADPSKIPSLRRTISISRADFNRLKSLAAGIDVGAPHHLLAMLAVYFSKVSGQRRLAFGLPFHNRADRRRKRLLGVFTSVSPLCIDTGANGRTFGALAQGIRRQQKANLRRQRYPLGHIIRDLPVLGNRRSIYDVAFNYLKLDVDLAFSGQNAELVYLSHNHEATPLMVTLCEYGDFGPVELRLDCSLAYFEEAEIELLADRLSFLLRSLGDAYSKPLAKLEILSEHEIQQLLKMSQGLLPEETPNRHIHDLFEAQASRSPDAIAVISAHDALTYRELNARANRVAHYLIRLGVKPESVVGVVLERTVDIVAALLGILKAGAAYLPLEQSHPPERVRVILEDARVQFVLTHRRLAKTLPASIRPILIDEIVDKIRDNENLDPATLGLTPMNLAYVIYTSGSTGKPKGVQIRHFNAVALLNWARTVFSAGELERVLASTSLTFDISVFEIFAPLSVGGQCVVVKDALDLLEKDVSVSLINTVPSAIKTLIEQDAIPDGVRVINLAGEPLPMQVVNDLLSARKCEKVFNLYGPSEDTTYSTYGRFEKEIVEAPDIGRAIAGTQAYILTPEGSLTPAGAVGELHLAGLGLARGYLNGPDLTAERFVPNPFSCVEGDRLYKTGDLARYQSGGVLEYVGRTDDQVKIRGFRIELGEIQKRLERLDQVKCAAVLARERREKYLVAYVERKRPGSFPDLEMPDHMWVNGLQCSLRTCLPEYMTPTIVVVDEMPLTPNGKVDKKALLALKEEFDAQYVPPSTATEAAVVNLWADLLGVDRQQVGATTSLFDFGGHSLLLVRLANAIRMNLGVKLPFRALFDVKDLRDLAGIIDAEAAIQRMEEKMSRSVIMSEGYF